jgi:hypothetical protein
VLLRVPEARATIETSSRRARATELSVSHAPTSSAIAALLLAQGCTGLIDPWSARSTADPDDPRAPIPTTDGSSPILELRRLTQYEYARAVDDLLGAAHPETSALYPRDPRTPFDNDASDQIPSEALITGAELLATESVAALLLDPARRDRVVGCTPSGATDGTCMRTFVRAFGRRAIRRAVSDDDVERYATVALTIAAEESDFYAGVDVVIRAFLQHPRFLYRVEVGAPVASSPGVVRLDGYEIASRLSFLVWGRIPDDALLDAALAGALDTPDGVRARAVAMLDDPRAAEQASRIHAMWLGIENLPHPASLSTAMRDETAALIEQVLIEDDRPWHDIFRETGTYVGDELATHYGLPLPGSSEPTYVPYGDSGRQGVLSHGAFLSHGGSTGDRMPIHRGLAVRRRLLCEHIELPVGFVPPPLATPATGECRADVLAAHASGGCAGCHSRLDPVGFGLEPFDGAGRAQSFEPGRPECEITGAGDLDGTPFVGPAGLADALTEEGLMAECFESQVYRYALGRSTLDSVDERILDVMQDAIGGSEFTYRDLVLAIVGSEAFFLRREPG